MEHKAILIKTQKLSDGAIAITHRCCEDEITDSVSTLYVTENTTPEAITAWAKSECERVQNQHDRLEAAHQHIQSLMAASQVGKKS